MFTTILYLITISFSYSYRDLQKSRPPTQKKDLRSPPQVLSFRHIPRSSHPLFVLSPVCPIPFRPIPFRPIICSSPPPARAVEAFKHKPKTGLTDGKH